MLHKRTVDGLRALGPKEGSDTNYRLVKVRPSLQPTYYIYQRNRSQTFGAFTFQDMLQFPISTAE